MSERLPLMQLWQHRTRAHPPQEQRQCNDTHLGEEDAGIGGHGTEAVQRGRVDINVRPDTVLEDLEERP